MADVREGDEEGRGGAIARLDSVMADWCQTIG